MAVEIERKFLLRDDSWRAMVRSSSRMAQGYLGGERCSVRVRQSGEQAWINVKSMELGVSRLEFEYPIPVADARTMLDRLCAAPVVSKTRHLVQIGRHCFEIDEFEGPNYGLLVAEIELAAPDEAFERPSWLGEEVTDDSRYYNVNLVRNPFSAWSQT